MAFSVGDRVLCIKTFRSRMRPWCDHGIAGVFYTVSKVYDMEFVDRQYIMLEELCDIDQNPEAAGWVNMERFVRVSPSLG